MVHTRANARTQQAHASRSQVVGREFRVSDETALRRHSDLEPHQRGLLFVDEVGCATRIATERDQRLEH
jgi:hypothetical protein